MLNKDDIFNGTHIKTFFRAPSLQLCDEELMKDFIWSLVDSIGMKALRSPIIDNVVLKIKERREECFVDEGGISGVITLSTSHIGMHTWPSHNNGRIIENALGIGVIDTSSCREFDKVDLERCLCNYYKVNWIRMVDFSFCLKKDIKDIFSIVLDDNFFEYFISEKTLI